MFVLSYGYLKKPILSVMKMLILYCLIRFVKEKPRLPTIISDLDFNFDSVVVVLH